MRRIGDKPLTNAERQAKRWERLKAEAAKAAEQDTIHGQEGRKVTKRLVRQFGDGEWHPVEEMIAAEERTAAAAGRPPANIRQLAKLLYQRAQLGCRVYGRQVGKSWEYQIFPSIDVVSIAEIRSKLQPLINDLIAEGDKTSKVRFDPSQVRRLAILQQKIIDDWAKATEAGGASNDDGVQSNDDSDDDD